MEAREIKPIPHCFPSPCNAIMALSFPRSCLCSWALNRHPTVFVSHLTSSAVTIMGLSVIPFKVNRTRLHFPQGRRSRLLTWGWNSTPAGRRVSPSTSAPRRKDPGCLTSFTVLRARRLMGSSQMLTSAQETTRGVPFARTSSATSLPSPEETWRSPLWRDGPARTTSTKACCCRWRLPTVDTVRIYISKQITAVHIHTKPEATFKAVVGRM